MRPRGNVPPKNPNHILEPLNEAETSASHPRKGATGPSISTKPKPTTQRTHSQVSLTVDSDDEGDDEEDTHSEFKRPPSKYRNTLKSRPVIESPDASDRDVDLDQVRKKKKIASDSDIEEIENPMESPEEELGELFKLMTYKYMVTYLFIFNLKNEWQEIGHHQSMGFSMRVR